MLADLVWRAVEEKVPFACSGRGSLRATTRWMRKKHSRGRIENAPINEVSQDGDKRRSNIITKAIVAIDVRLNHLASQALSVRVTTGR
jgi:hypothetical protein